MLYFSAVTRTLALKWNKSDNALIFYVHLQVLQDLAMDFIIPNYNSVVKTGEYLYMSNALKDRLTLDLAAEDTFVGLKRKRRD